MRKTAIACGVIGAILLAAAGLLAFWITPQFIARLPANSHTVRTYDGQIRSLVDPVALRQGNFAAAIKVGLPETLRQQVQVLQTSGNKALVRDTDTVTVAGRQIGAVTSQYAVDRKSLAATGSHPASWNVTPATGLTVSWPIGAKQQSYTGEVVDLSTTEREMGGVALPDGRIIPVIPVLADSYRGSSASVRAAASDATNGSNTIRAIGTIVPIVAASLGFVLIVIAVVLWRRGRGARASVPLWSSSG